MCLNSLSSFIYACFQNKLNSPECYIWGHPLIVPLMRLNKSLDGNLLGMAKLLHHAPCPPLQKTSELEKLGCVQLTSENMLQKFMSKTQEQSICLSLTHTTNESN